jgi:hypothetical protein
LGWVEAQNLRVDVRWNAGNAGLSQTYEAQLIGLMPDVILVASTTNLTAIRQATSTVPVVFVSVSDPVAQGFVASAKHPGGRRLFHTFIGPMIFSHLANSFVVFAGGARLYLANSFNIIIQAHMALVGIMMTRIGVSPCII